MSGCEDHLRRMAHAVSPGAERTPLGSAVQARESGSDPARPCGSGGSTDEPVDVSVLVVSWRTRDLLDQMLSSTEDAFASGLPECRYEVVVVDNNSTDGTAEMLDERYGRPPFKSVCNPFNAGYAGGNNQAFAKASGEWIVVANPDLELNGDALAAMLEHAATHPETGITTCELVDEDGHRQALHRSQPTLGLVLLTQTRFGRRVDNRILGGGAARRYRLVDRPVTGVVRITQAGGALLVLHRRVVEATGGHLFDQQMPILMNDVELSRRALDAGLAIDLLADHRVQHRGGASLDQVEPLELHRRFWSGLIALYELHEPRWKQAVLRAAALSVLGLQPHRAHVDGLSPTAQPLVSIVVISHNYGHHLAEAIESAADQDYPNIEVLVVDDGSTDDTAEVAARYAKSGVRYHFKPRGGLSHSRNVGARMARGELLVFLDADDRLAPAMVSKALEALRFTSAALAYTQIRYFGSTTGVSSLPDWDEDRLKDGNYIAATSLVRTEVVRGFPYDESNRIGWEDWDFLLGLAERGHEGILVDEALFEYRRHESSMTAAIAGLAKRDRRRRIQRRHIRFVGLGRYLRSEIAYLRMWLGVNRRVISARARARSRGAG